MNSIAQKNIRLFYGITIASTVSAELALGFLFTQYLNRVESASSLTLGVINAAWGGASFSASYCAALHSDDARRRAPYILANAALVFSATTVYVCAVWVGRILHAGTLTIYLLVGTAYVLDGIGVSVGTPPREALLVECVPSPHSLTTMYTRLSILSEIVSVLVNGTVFVQLFEWDATWSHADLQYVFAVGIGAWVVYTVLLTRFQDIQEPALIRHSLLPRRDAFHTARVALVIQSAALSVASGLSTTFMALYLVDVLLFSPSDAAAVAFVTSGVTLVGTSLFLRLAQSTAPTKLGAVVIVRVCLVTVLLGWLLFARNAAPYAIVAFNAAVTAPRPVTESVLMSLTTRDNAAQWATWNNLGMLVWSLSAALGGYLVHSWGYIFTFYCGTAALMISTVSLTCACRASGERSREVPAH